MMEYWNRGGFACSLQRGLETPYVSLQGVPCEINFQFRRSLFHRAGFCVESASKQHLFGCFRSFKFGSY